MTSAGQLPATGSVVATTVGEWFANLQPPPPEALAKELRTLLHDVASRPVGDVPEVCLETSERLLEKLMRSGSTERATALTLLAVDSLVTYAFQAASGAPEQIEARAAGAMRRIAELGERNS